MGAGRGTASRVRATEDCAVNAAAHQVHAIRELIPVILLRELPRLHQVDEICKQVESFWRIASG
jgi:hypothetical protein